MHLSLLYKSPKSSEQWTCPLTWSRYHLRMKVPTLFWGTSETVAVSKISAQCSDWKKIESLTTTAITSKMHFIGVSGVTLNFVDISFVIGIFCFPRLMLWSWQSLHLPIDVKMPFPMANECNYNYGTLENWAIWHYWLFDVKILN